MRKIILNIILISLIYFNGFSQDSIINYISWDSTKYHIRFPVKSKEFKIKRELSIYDKSIDLYLHPKIIFSENQRSQYNLLIDSTRNSENSKIIYNNKIILKSGISWDLTGEPPLQPKYFYFKALTKKGRQDSTVINRLEYLQFYYYWNINKMIPYDMVDKIYRNLIIYIDNRKCFEYSYEFIINKQSRIKLNNSMMEFYN